VAPSSDVGFWDLLSMVVDSATPELNPETSSPEIRAFMSACLQKDPAKRPSPLELLDHPFIRMSEQSPVDLKTWIRQHIPPDQIDPTAPEVDNAALLAMAGGGGSSQSVTDSTHDGRASVDEGGSSDATPRKPTTERRGSSFLRTLNPFKKDTSASSSTSS